MKDPIILAPEQVPPIFFDQSHSAKDRLAGHLGGRLGY